MLFASPTRGDTMGAQRPFWSGRGITVLIGLILAFAVLAVPVVAVAAGTITGTVTDGSSAKVDGVLVQAFGTLDGVSKADTYTDANGLYTLTVADDGDYVLRVATGTSVQQWATMLCGTASRVPAWYLSYVSDPVKVAGDIKTVDITVRRRSDLRVTVVRPVVPLVAADGVTVYLYYQTGTPADWSSEPSIQGVTDAAGRVTFADTLPQLAGEEKWRLLVADSRPAPYARYQTREWPMGGGVPPLPGYFTVPQGVVPHDYGPVPIAKYDEAGISVPGGETWQAAPAGVTVTVTRTVNDIPSHLWYQLDGGAEVDAGDVSSVPLLVTGAGEHLVRAWTANQGNEAELGPLATASVRILGPQPGIGRPTGRVSVRRGRSATYSGKFASRVANRSHVVLQAWRWDGAVWVLARTRQVHVTTPRRGKSRYSGSLRFTERGSYKVVARFEGDASWWWQGSEPRFVTVR